MKKNLPVSQVEVDYANSATITSATDVKGRITYVNADFLNISGFGCHKSGNRCGRFK